MRTSISFHRPPCTCTPLVVSLSRADATTPKQNLPTGSPQEGEGVRAWAWLIHSTTQVSFDLLSRPGVVKCRGAFLKFLSTSLTSLRPILGKCQGGCSDSANSERLKAARAQREYNCDICWHAAKPLQTSTTASNNFLTYHLAFISWSPGPVGGLRACHFNWRLSYLWPLDSQAAPVISILLFLIKNSIFLEIVWRSTIQQELWHQNTLLHLSINVSIHLFIVLASFSVGLGSQTHSVEFSLTCQSQIWILYEISCSTKMHVRELIQRCLLSCVTWVQIVWNAQAGRAHSRKYKPKYINKYSTYK